MRAGFQGSFVANREGGPDDTCRNTAFSHRMSRTDWGAAQGIRSDSERRAAERNSEGRWNEKVSRGPGFPCVLRARFVEFLAELVHRGSTEPGEIHPSTDSTDDLRSSNKERAARVARAALALVRTDLARARLDLQRARQQQRGHGTRSRQHLSAVVHGASTPEPQGPTPLGG